MLTPGVTPTKQGKSITLKAIIGWPLRFLILFVLFLVFFMGGAQAVNGLLPDIKAEPGLVSPETAILLIGIANTLIVMGLVRSSRWSGRKLMLVLSLVYYGAVSFIMQIEAWYFLHKLTVSDQLLPRLFIMGLPVAFLFIPLAVLILGKGRKSPDSDINSNCIMPVKQWVIKLIGIVAAYLILYWSAGYFIAWQNPEVRAFYGSPELVSFWTQTVNTLRSDPGLFPFQMVRALLWTLFALPIIRGSRMNVWWTAVLVGLFFSVPQNLGHIMENPLMPIASVRLSHMIETASSTFVFGLIVTWLLHRRHSSLKDLFV